MFFSTFPEDARILLPLPFVYCFLPGISFPFPFLNEMSVHTSQFSSILLLSFKKFSAKYFKNQEFIAFSDSRLVWYQRRKEREDIRNVCAMCSFIYWIVPECEALCMCSEKNKKRVPALFRLASFT